MSGPVEALLRGAGHPRMAHRFAHLHRRWAATLGTESWSEADSAALLVELAYDSHRAPGAADARPAGRGRRGRGRPDGPLAVQAPKRRRRP